MSDDGDKKQGFAEDLDMDSDYAYDANGNLTSDKNKSITSITYNYLNLPDKVTKSTGDALYYTYDAAGRKLTQVAGVKTSDYRGEWFYENDTLRFVNHEEGRAISSGEWTSAQQLLPDPDMNTTTANFVAFAPTNITMSNVTSGGQGYLKVLSNQSTSTPGFTTLSLSVIPGRSYTLKLKGYSEGPGTGALFVQAAGPYLGLSIFPGPSIPQSSANEGWVELTFKVPGSVNTIQVGALWKSGTAVSGSSILYINKMELYEYNGIHGNTTFSQTGYEYQYHLKDHLGNVRMTFTTKDEVEISKATFETANAASEAGQFKYYSEAVTINSEIFDHTNAGTTYYSTRLNGTPTERYGLAKSLSVMPGDTINAQVFVKYLDPTTPETSALAAFFATIGDGSAPLGTFKDGGLAGSTGGLLAPFWALFAEEPENDNEDAPKAYLNWLIFDRNYILKDGGALQISTAAAEHGQDSLHEELTKQLVIKEAGYVYVYLSNDNVAINNESVEVYFDDFKVEHVKSPVVQSQDYYPFGLTYNSYSRENSFNNRWKFQGQEHIDELGVNWDSFKWRNHQPDIGRFFNVDPLSEKYYYNSPYVFSENQVVAHRELEGLEKASINDEVAEANGTNQNTYKKVDGNKRFWKGLEETGKQLPGKAASATDINDATVLATWITRGDGAINADGTKATAIDRGVALAGAIVPVVSGSAVKKVVEGVTNALSPKVQGIVNTIKEIVDGGGSVQPNKLSPTQEVNLTLKDKAGDGLNLRIETHEVPSKYGGDGTGRSQRHMNVEPITPAGNKKKTNYPNNGHVILE